MYIVRVSIVLPLTSIGRPSPTPSRSTDDAARRPRARLPPRLAPPLVRARVASRRHGGDVRVRDARSRDDGSTHHSSSSSSSSTRARGVGSFTARVDRRIRRTFLFVARCGVRDGVDGARRVRRRSRLLSRGEGVSRRRRDAVVDVVHGDVFVGRRFHRSRDVVGWFTLDAFGRGHGDVQKRRGE